MDSSEVRTRSSLGCECVKHIYGQHLNLGNERSFRFGSAGIREASQTRAKKNNILLPFHLFLISYKLREKEKQRFSSMLSFHVLCFVT
jgi:hypothetical protein